MTVNLEDIVKGLNGVQVEQARTTEQIKNLAEQVRKQNGNVLELFRRMNKVEKEITTHPVTCPWEGRMNGLENAISNHLEKTGEAIETKKIWKQRVFYPMIRSLLTLLGAALILLLYQHGSQILSGIKQLL